MSDVTIEEIANASRPGIVRRVDLAGLRRADRIVRDAEAHRAQTELQAQEAHDDLLEAARKKALLDSTRTAARLIADAEEEARRKIAELEPQLAKLVADTVRAILGDMEPEEVRYRAALNALRTLRDHHNGRIYCPSSMAQTMRRAAADVPPGGAEVQSVVIDDQLEDGVAVLSSDKGHTDIGLAALTDAALQAWEEDDADGS